MEISGPNPIGGTLTGHGVRTPAGVTLEDTTTPTWDAATRRGGIVTHDATGLRDMGQLPGKLVTSPDPTIRDPEAMAAHALSREVYDYYYEEFGRESWDGKGAPLISSVNFGPSDFCNSYFTMGVQPPQMVYGNPCTIDGEGQVEVTEVEIDTAGHEITHGVTASTAGLLYSGQAGALNESFSDYLGNVIGNRVNGTDSVALFENGCTGITTPTLFCKPNPDGSLSLRYMLTGNDFDDYLRVLDPGLRLTALELVDQDHGGVHRNSAIWNNALWSIRVQLAKIDNLPGNESPLAADFDRVVYAALTSRMGPTAGFIDARNAIEQVIIDAQLDPVVLRVTREVFDANKICTGCPTVDATGGSIVSTSPETQLQPAVSGDRVAWVSLSSWSDGYAGYPATASADGGAAALGSVPNTLQVGFAGDALVTVDFNGQVVRSGADGTTDVVARLTQSSFSAGLAGSDTGAAWVADRSISFLDESGRITTGSLPDLQGDTVLGLGTGGGTVAFGTDAGLVFSWQPGSEVRRIGKMPGAVLSVATYGGNVLAIDDSGQARLFTKDGAVYGVSSNAAPFGVAMSSEYAVWPETKGNVEADVVQGGVSKYPETDLYLLSLGSGKTYDLLPHQGQQGFPSLSGRQLVWQDATFGGDDILTAELPPGL